MAKKEAKTKNKENTKNKKSFWKDFKAELKKVVWPTPKQLVNNTVAVITIVLITAAIVFVLDLVFETANKYGVDKIKEVISTNETTENATTDEEATESDSEEATGETEATSEETENTEATSETPAEESAE